MAMNFCEDPREQSANIDNNIELPRCGSSKWARADDRCNELIAFDFGIHVISNSAAEISFWSLGQRPVLNAVHALKLSLLHLGSLVIISLMNTWKSRGPRKLFLHKQKPSASKSTLCISDWLWLQCLFAVNKFERPRAGINYRGCQLGWYRDG